MLQCQQSVLVLSVNIIPRNNTVLFSQFPSLTNYFDSLLLSIINVLLIAWPLRSAPRISSVLSCPQPVYQGLNARGWALIGAGIIWTPESSLCKPASLTFFFSFFFVYITVQLLPPTAISRLCKPFWLTFSLASFWDLLAFAAPLPSSKYLHTAVE